MAGASNAQDIGLALLLIDGVAQAGGILMSIAGVTSRRYELVRNDVSRLHLTPIASAKWSGLAMTGTF